LRKGGEEPKRTLKENKQKKNEKKREQPGRFELQGKKPLSFSHDGDLSPLSSPPTADMEEG